MANCTVLLDYDPETDEGTECGAPSVGFDTVLGEDYHYCVTHD